MPGWYNAVAPSFAYHGDDGRLFSNSHQPLKDYAGPYGKGDTIGCGVIYNESIEGMIFYTRNGEPQGMMTFTFYSSGWYVQRFTMWIGIAFENNVKGRLYPAVGMEAPTALVVNFGNDIESRPFKWERANSGKYDIDAVKKKVDPPVTEPVSIETGTSKPPV